MKARKVLVRMLPSLPTLIASAVAAASSGASRIVTASYLPLCPIDLFDRAAQLFGEILEGLSSFRGVFDVRDALVSEIG